MNEIIRPHNLVRGRWLYTSVILLTACIVITLSGCNFFEQSETIPITPSPSISAQQQDHTSSQPTSEAEQFEELNAPAMLAHTWAELPDLKGAPRYTIDLSVNPDMRTFDGYARVEYTNSEDTPLDQVYFRLLPNGGGSYGDGSLNVSQVLVDGKSIKADLSLSDSVLNIPLQPALDASESVQIELEFSGQVPANFGGTNGPAGYGIFNFSDGVLSLANWYPILAVYDEQGWNLDPVSSIGDSVYSDMAYYTVNLTAPGELLVASTGVEIERQASNGKTRYQFISGPARDFYIIMSQNFQVDSEIVDGTSVNIYRLHGDQEGSEEILSIATNSLRVYNELFGHYPYSELDIVAAPLRYALGVEYPGIVLIREDLTNEPADPTLAFVVAHEIAHQWWYNLVGNDVYDDPWLDEALASYSSSLAFEFSGNTSTTRTLINYWEQHYAKIVERGQDDRVTQSLLYFEAPDNPRAYGGIVYSKGALFFKALREKIGDEAFFRALQAYYQTYQYRIARPDDLLNTFEESSGRSLEELYNEWLYSP